MADNSSASFRRQFRKLKLMENVRDKEGTYVSRQNLRWCVAAEHDVCMGGVNCVNQPPTKFAASTASKPAEVRNHCLCCGQVICSKCMNAGTLAVDKWIDPEPPHQVQPEGGAREHVLNTVKLCKVCFKQMPIDMEHRAKVWKLKREQANELQAQTDQHATDLQAKRAEIASADDSVEQAEKTKAQAHCDKEASIAAAETEARRLSTEVEDEKAATYSKAAALVADAAQEAARLSAEAQDACTAAKEAESKAEQLLLEAIDAAESARAEAAAAAAAVEDNAAASAKRQLEISAEALARKQRAHLAAEKRKIEVAEAAEVACAEAELSVDPAEQACKVARQTMRSKEEELSELQRTQTREQEVLQEEHELVLVKEQEVLAEMFLTEIDLSAVAQSAVPSSRVGVHVDTEPLLMLTQ
jgi:hypothetical protein